MSRDTGIGIIGMAGKYPKADSPLQLWQNIIAGTDMSDETGPETGDRVRRHFPLDGIDLFDNAFFGFTPFESQIMDPQHRVMLTCAYRAMEHAGYERIPPGLRVGVFASTSISTYLINVILKSHAFDSSDINYQVLLGNDKDTLATRIAYKLNLTGPAITIQCACSSSLVALHYACQSLLSGDSDICVVGGVSITVPQDGGYHYKEGGILSRDGYCRPFDKGASGTIKGNGCSALVLRRLADAEREGDAVHAVIRGTAANNDGGDKIGFTAPSIAGQRSVIQEALSFAGVRCSDVDYVEAHGTGTDLGDQIELTALAAAFHGPGDKIPLGSLKANIGHLDVAAGATSVIKSVLAIKHGVVPAIANLRQPSDVVKAATARFDFPQKSSHRKLETVAVSSFGIGGTNAHAVIGRYESQARVPHRDLPFYLIPIYLNKPEDREAYGASIRAQLREGVSLLDLAATLATRRKRRAIVHCIVAQKAEDISTQLGLPLAPQENAELTIPRFSLQELRELSRELPCMSVIRAECASSGTLGEAESLVQLLARLGVLAVPELMEHSRLPVIARGADYKAVSYASSIVFNDSENGPAFTASPPQRLLQFLAQVHGNVDLDLAELYRGTHWRPVSLPAYPLRPVRHWIDVEAPERAGPVQNALAVRRSLHDDELLDEIVSIWRDGIGEEQIAVDTSFADAGADSLTSIEIIDRINRAYGSAISVTQSLANVTPQELAALVLGREVRSSTPWASYVRYRSSHARTVFLVHPAGGSTFCYSALSRRLTVDVNLCAIDLPEGYEGYTSLNALARRYAALVKTYQPAGPYYLGGYSFGGNLAHELASVLEQDGSVVETVFMFDSHPPEAYNLYDGSGLDYVGAFPTLVASYFKPELIEVATREGAGLKDLSAAVEVVRGLGILRRSISNEDIARFFARWVFSHSLLKAHRPVTRVDAGLVIFVAREDEPPILLEKLKINSVSKTHWETYFTNPVRSIPVDGDHFTIFSEPRRLKNLAKEFEAALQMRREVLQSFHENPEWNTIRSV